MGDLFACKMVSAFVAAAAVVCAVVDVAVGLVVVVVVVAIVTTIKSRSIEHNATRETTRHMHCDVPFRPISLVASIVAAIAFCKNETKELSSSSSSSCCSASGGGSDAQRESSRDTAHIHVANAPAKIARCMRARDRLITTF